MRPGETVWRWLLSGSQSRAGKSNSPPIVGGLDPFRKSSVAECPFRAPRNLEGYRGFLIALAL